MSFWNSVSSVYIGGLSIWERDFQKPVGRRNNDYYFWEIPPTGDSVDYFDRVTAMPIQDFDFQRPDFQKSWYKAFNDSALLLNDCNANWDASEYSERSAEPWSTLKIGLKISIIQLSVITNQNCDQSVKVGWNKKHEQNWWYFSNNEKVKLTKLKKVELLLLDLINKHCDTIK